MVKQFEFRTNYIYLSTNEPFSLVFNFELTIKVIEFLSQQAARIIRPRGRNDKKQPVMTMSLSSVSMETRFHHKRSRLTAQNTPNMFEGTAHRWRLSATEFFRWRNTSQTKQSSTFLEQQRLERIHAKFCGYKLSQSASVLVPQQPFRPHS